MNRKMVRFNVTSQLILQALAIPESAKIYDIVRDWKHPDQFIFMVESDELPEVQECAEPVEISPIIHCDPEKRPSTWMTFDWNLPSSPNP